MFNFFRRRTAKELMDEARETYTVPEVKAPAVPKEEPAKIFYRLGLTDNNRVAFSMGYSEVTMNREGCQQMIDQLTFYMNQITEEEESATPSP